jgi:hypothetical protein
MNVGVGGAVVDGGADVTVAAAGDGTERGRGGGAAMRMWRRDRRMMRRSEDAVRSVVGADATWGRAEWVGPGEAERRRGQTHERRGEYVPVFSRNFSLFRIRDKSYIFPG